MAKRAKTAWGIDVGNCTLKAIKLARGPEGIEVLDFAVIEHEKILSQSEVTPEERIELISRALSNFLDNHEVTGSTIVASVPGQNSFARFIKLPPVDKKRIHELVRYEAIQQIPFNIDDVEWDWQTFETADSPEVEVGIFAIKRELVKKALQPYNQAGCPVSLVQMAPMALYNFLRYDVKKVKTTGEKQAVIALDIGAENTDLVIADGVKVWQRSIPIGGNHFTATVQKSFKLSFAKAEGIKRTANTSKYARQIFQAMRSVFADLAAEIQRSLGFYSSGNRDVQFREVIALGNAMKLPGLVKFLQQSLSIPVKRLDSFETLKIAPDVSVAQLTECLPSLGVASGLALQGVGQGEIDINLLPREIARQGQWKRKRNWFVGAAALFLVSSLTYFLMAVQQERDIQSGETTANVNTIASIQNEISSQNSEKEKIEKAIKDALNEIGNHEKIYQQEDYIPLLLQAVIQCLPNENNTSDPDQVALYQAYRNGQRQAVMELPRSQRQQIFIHDIKLVYTEDLSQNFESVTAPLGTESSRPKSIGGSGTDPMAAYLKMMGMGAGKGPAGFSKKSETSESAAAKGQAKGFVVVIEGSTPHQDNIRFLYPPDVGVQRDKWGFFTRLRYLGKTNQEILAEQEGAKAEGEKKTAGALKKGDAKKTDQPIDVEQLSAEEKFAYNLPFVTYVAPDAENITDYFDQTQSDWISGAIPANQPQGIGILQVEEEPDKERRPTAAAPARASNDPMADYLRMMGMGAGAARTGGAARAGGAGDGKLPVYVDPFTLEPISNTYKRNEAGEIAYDPAGNPIIENHDYWFRLKLKVKLKETDADTAKK